MTATLFSKLGQITIRLTSLAINILWTFDEPAIFQVLGHLNDLEIIVYGSHFVFQGQKFSQAKHLQARIFHGLSLHSECDERTHRLTAGRTLIQKLFYNLLTKAFGRRHEIKILTCIFIHFTVPLPTVKNIH